MVFNYRIKRIIEIYRFEIINTNDIIMIHKIPAECFERTCKNSMVSFLFQIQGRSLNKSFNRCLLSILLLTISGVHAIAQVVVTSSTNWSSITINPGDDVFVENGATLTIDIQGAQCSNLTLGSNINTPGNGSLFFDTNSDLTITNDLILGQALFSAGVSLNQGTLFIEGSLINNNGVFNPGTGTVEFSGNNQQVPSDLLGWTFFSIKFSGSGTKTIQGGGVLQADGNIEISSGITFDVSGSDIAIGGSWINNGSFINNNNSITFDGTGNTNIITGNLTGSDKFHRLIFNGGGKWTFQSDAEVANNINISNGSEVIVDPTFQLSVSGNLTNSNGIFSFPGAFLTITGNLTNDLGGIINSGDVINIAGNWQNIGNSVYNYNTSSVVFNGIGIQTVNNGSTSADQFYNITVGGASTLQPNGNDLRVFNDLVISGGGTINSNGKRIGVQGNWANNGSFIANDDTVFIFGSKPNRTISGNLNGANSFSSLLFSGVVPTGSLGSWTIMDPINVTANFNVTGGYEVKANAFFDGVGLSATISGDSTKFECGKFFRVDGDIIIKNKGLLVADSVIIVKGNWTNTTNGDFIAGSSVVRFNGNSTQKISSNGRAFNKIAHNTTNDTLLLLDQLTAGGEIVNALGSGPLNANGFNIFIGGNWNFPSSFIPGSASQKVIFNGLSDQTLYSANSVFQNVAHNSSNNLTVSPNGSNELNVLGNLENTSGVFDLEVNGIDAIIGGNLINSGATSIFNAGPQVFIGGNLDNNTNATYNSGDDLELSGNWSNASNAAYNAGITSTVYGNWNNGINAIFAHGNGTIIFSGATIHNVDNSGDSFFNITHTSPGSTLLLTGSMDIAGDLVNSNATFDADGKAIQIKGDWSNTGTFIPGSASQTVTFNGASSQNVNNGTSHFQNLTHSSTTTLQLISNELFVDGDLANSGGILDAQAIGLDITVAGDITNSGSGSNFKAGPNLSVAGNLNNISNAVFNAGILVDVDGNFTNDNATYNSDVNFFVAGNWTNRGNFNPGNGSDKVTFNGGVLQEIGGTVSTVFKRLNISNAVTLTGVNISVDTDLEFSGNGDNITTDTNRVIIDSNTTVTNAGQAKGYINGNESIFIKTASGLTVNFHVGDSSLYTPVSVKFNGATAGVGTVTARSVSGDVPNENNPVINSSGINQLKKVNRYYRLSEQNVVYSDFDATFNFVAADLLNSPLTDSFAVRRFDFGNSAWQASTIGTRTSTSTQCVNNTGFGDFEIGEKNTLSVAVQPVDIISCAGTDTVFTCSGTGFPLADVQWERDDNNGSGFQPINAATDGGVYGNSYNTYFLTITNPGVALDGYDYRAVLSNINGTVVTSQARLSLKQPVDIVNQPVSLVLCADSIALFVVGTPGTGLGYQWFYNGTPISGENNDTLKISQVSLTDAGNYYCLVTGESPCQPEQSAIASLTVKEQPPKPSISSALLDSISPLCSGSANISFMLDSVDPSLSFSWSSSSNPALLINDSLYMAVITAPNSGSAYQGSIRVVYTNSINCTSEAVFYIDVKEDLAPDTAPVILKQPGNLLVYLDNTADQYLWGYDLAGTRIPDTLEGQVYQSFVPEGKFLMDDPNTTVINDMILNTIDYYYWVQVKTGDCVTRAYYNGPFAKKFSGAVSPPIAEEISLSIMPNLNHGDFDMEVSGNMYGALQFHVVNSMGQVLVIQSGYKAAGIQKFKMNLPEISAGLYYLMVTGSQNQQLSAKFIVK